MGVCHPALLDPAARWLLAVPTALGRSGLDAADCDGVRLVGSAGSILRRVHSLPHCLSRLTADVAVGGGPRISAEGASNLLLHLGPAQVALNLVIREGHPQIRQEGQDAFPLQEQGVQQVLGGRLLAPSASPSSCVRRRCVWWGWLGGEALGEQLMILGDPLAPL